jgi:outer membrane protein insertion porin family
MLLSRFASASALVAFVGAPALAEDSPVVVVEGDSPRSVTPRKPTGTFEVGVGISPDDGFLAHAAVVQPDLFRTGQRLALTADMSAIRQRAALTYDLPVLPNLDLHTELFTQRRDFGAFLREGTGGELALVYKLDKHTRIYGRYRAEAVATSLDAANRKPSELPALTEAALGNGTIATLGVGLVHDTLDERWLPRRGTRFELFTDRADRRWGSAYTFERTGGSFDHARGLGPLTLRLHGHAAYVRGDVPLSERLQHDGHAEVRGYALDSLPRLGSNVEAVGRVELETPSWKGLSIAGWADAGLRENTDPMYGGSSPLLQRSVGLSLIWRSPIGPLRFDWAVPLDGDQRDRQILFGIGGSW